MALKVSNCDAHPKFGPSALGVCNDQSPIVRASLRKPDVECAFEISSNIHSGINLERPRAAEAEADCLSFTG
jgi:hypothetical protein